MNANRKHFYPLEPDDKDKTYRTCNVSNVTLHYNKEKKTVTISLGNSQISLRTIREVYEVFKDFCRRLGKTVGEATVQAWIEYMQVHASELPYQTVINIFQPGSRQINVNLPEKIELKLVKRDLTIIIEKLEKGQGDRNFFLQRLRETLPKAIRVYEKTFDPEVKELLARSEKLI